MKKEMNSLKTLFVPDIQLAKYANIPIKKEGEIEYGYLEFFTLDELTELQKEIVAISTGIK